MRALVLARRVLAALVLPRGMRRRYGAEMEATFRALLREARESSGAAGMARVAGREAWDLLRAAVDLRRMRESTAGQGVEDGTAPGELRAGRRTTTGGEGAMAGALEELWIAVRTLARRPGWTSVTVGTVALGVGSATAMFALVEGVLIRPLPYDHPERLVHVFQTNPELGWERGPVSFPNFDDWRREAEVFQALGAYQAGVRETLMGDGTARAIRGTRVSGELFGLLGVPALHGRLLAPRDEGPEGAPVLLLSHAFWMEAFGGDPAAVGREVALGDARYTVVGVMPEDFPPLWREEQFWVPFPFAASDTDRDQSFLSVLGRLRGGVTPAEAEAHVEALIRRIERTHPEGNEGRSAHVETRAQVLTGHVEDQLLLFMGAVGLLLLLACANLAALVLARGTDRRRELAVRSALGAGRPRLVRALVVESLAVAAVGAVLAFPLARGLVDAVVAFGPADLPRRGELGLNAVSLAFGSGSVLLCAGLFGLLPALRVIGRGDLQRELKEGGRGGGTQRAGRLQHGLVVVQLALAVALLTGAGLLGSSLLTLQEVDRGFDGRGVLTFRVEPPAGAYQEPEELDGFYRDVVESLARVRGVDAVGATWSLPFGESFGSSRYQLEGRPDGDGLLVQLVPVRGHYFDAMGIPLRRGRGFRPGEGGEGPLVAIVNETLAERAWPGEDPLGKRLRKGSGAEAVFVEVVGVAPDLTMQALGAAPPAQAFFPHAAVPWARGLYFTLRTAGEAPGADGGPEEADPLALVPAVRGAVAAVDPRVPVSEVRTMAARLSGELAGPRFRTFLVLAFAGAASLLALGGTYGLMVFVVSGRTREIGIRMALGARRGRILLGVLGRGTVLALAGASVGLGIALASSPALEGLLYETDPVAPRVYAGVATLVLVATLAASWVPARRASGVAPGTVLREE